MIKAKGNYKNGFSDLTCRICKKEEETQTHILEMCPDMHPSDATKVLKHQLFSEDIDTLRVLAKKIEIIMEKLSDIVY